MDLGPEDQDSFWNREGTIHFLQSLASAVIVFPLTQLVELTTTLCISVGVYLLCMSLFVLPDIIHC